MPGSARKFWLPLVRKAQSEAEVHRLLTAYPLAYRYYAYNALDLHSLGVGLHNAVLLLAHEWIKISQHLECVPDPDTMDGRCGMRFDFDRLFSTPEQATRFKAVLIGLEAHRNTLRVYGSNDEKKWTPLWEKSKDGEEDDDDEETLGEENPWHE